MMKKFLLIAVLSYVTTVLSEPLHAASDSFSVNFYAYGKGGADLWGQEEWRETVRLETGQAAGFGEYNTTGWVNVAIPWGMSSPADPLTLTSNQGFMASFTLKDVRNGGPYSRTAVRDILLGDGNADMMDAHVNATEDPGDGSNIFDMTMTGIPYSTYDVIVYFGGGASNFGDGSAKIVFNGVEQGITVKKALFNGTFTEIVDSVTAGNYIVFEGVTGSSFTTQVWGNGFNHIGPSGFQVYAADTTGQLPDDDILLALTELKGYVQGTKNLSDSEIAAHKSAIDADKLLFGLSENVMTAALEYVEAYDAAMGPLWVDGVKRWPDWDRRLVTDDIHWTTYNIMQYIMDYTYTAANLAAHESLIGSFKFGSADYFPGHVDPPTDPEVIHTAKINASFPKTYGHDTMHWTDRPARKCTGAYLAPGTIATVTVPPSMVNKGYQIRVGAHALDLKNKPFVKRLDRSSLAYDITSTETKVTNPLGGGIYIEVPYLAEAGVVDIQIKNTVRAPYYSYNTVTGDITTLSDWQNTERNLQAPWADFQSEKFMMQVPTSWIYALDDPVTLMANWDKAIDAANDLMGFDHDRGKESSYDQVDVLIDAGAYSPGYPTCNNTYDPRAAYNGYVNSYLVRGPQYAPSMHFHEIGHGYLFQKFSSETESVVNLLHVPIWNRKFGYDLDMAFRSSRGFNNNEYITLDTTAVCWMTCQNFKNNQPMTSSEKKYQLKGHAKFVDIARMFGWDVLGDYWRSFNDDYENGISWAKDDDSLLLRLSRAVGCDIRPLFHFWGVPPKNASSLQAAFAAENLPASNKIYDTLDKYKSLVPADNSEFQASLLNWYGHPPTSDGATTERDHADSWDIYDTSTAGITRDNVQNIIDLYFPGGRPGLDIGSDKITWSGKTVQMNPVFNGGYSAASFVWSAEPADGVVFAPNANVESPTVTINLNTSNPSVVTIKLITDGDAGVEEDTMTLDVYDDPCKAAIGKGISANYPADIDGNCIIDLHDFAILAATWLDDGALTGPIIKP